MIDTDDDKTGFAYDRRGVSEVIGSILVFGLVVGLLAIIQTQGIPAANQQVEFNHNQEVQGDLVEFHQVSSQIATRGTGESVSIQAGTGYPSRLLFFNPPRVTGSISTSQQGTVEIRNVSSTDPEVDDYLEDAGRNLSLESRTFRYQANYNELEGTPTTRYEYGILYNEYSDATTIQNPGSVIDDTDINLVFMAGDYSRSNGAAQSLDIRPVSAPARPVTIEGEGGNDIELVLPTDMPVGDWKELYLDQGSVLGVSEGPESGTVKITLDGDKRYTLRMAKLGLEPGIPKPDAHYIVPADDGVTTIGAGQTGTVKYEVRDEYNNPVSGVDVEITLPNGTNVTKTTDGDGRVARSVTSEQRVGVNAKIDACSSGEARCSAEYLVQVSDLNPNPATGVILRNATTAEVAAPLLDLTIAGDEMGFILESEDENMSMTRFRINHYHSDPGGHSPVTLTDEDGNQVSDMNIGGEFVDADDGLDQLNEVKTSGSAYKLTFNENVETDHYVVLTVVYENNERALYFASPTS